MTAQSFLAKNGLRTGLLGSAASLAIAFGSTNDPAAHTAANRTGWFGDLTGGAEAVSTVIAGATVETVTADGLELNQGGFLFNERAAVPAAPGVGQGYLWVRDDAPNLLVFTDDTGVDTVLRGGLLVAAAAGTDNYGTIAIGALASTVAGDNFNIAIGTNALTNSSADGATAVGYQAGRDLTAPSFSTLLGMQAAGGATTAQRLTCLGYQSYVSGSGGQANIAVGMLSMRYGRMNAIVEESSIAIGYQAMRGSASVSNNTGVSNIALGARTLDGIEDGSRNIGIGNLAGATSTSGDDDVLLGDSADTSGASVDRGTAVGASTTVDTDSTVLGFGATSTASNQLVAGSPTSPVTDIYFGDGVTHTAPSDWTLHGVGGSGTDIAGGDATIAGGQGTGTGAGGNVIFQTAPAGSTGAAANALATVFQATETAIDFVKGFVQSGKTTVTGAGGSPDATADGAISVYLLDGSSGTCTLDLDASPVDGQRYEIKSIDSTNTVTIERNGNTIDGANSDITLATNESVTLIYDTTFGWAII